MKEKIFWIGDDGDFKCAAIAGKVYQRGQEIPADKVAPEVLKEWIDKGLAGKGREHAPLVVKDTGAIAVRDAEIRALKRRLDEYLPYKNEVGKLKSALDKSKAEKKGKAEREAELVAELKAKTAEIVELTAQVEALTKPDGKPDGFGGKDK